MRDLKDKTILITGASGNLGAATARAFAAQGARTVLIGRNPEALHRTQATLPAGTESLVISVDLLDSEQVTAMVEQVEGHFGAIQGLINIAGGFRMGPAIQDTTDADWNAMLDLNARTAFHCARAVVPKLLAAGQGTIVNVAARAALRGLGHMGPYCISKAAVVTLTETLADELKSNGIRVNCVLPGTLDTPQNRAAMPDQDPSNWVGLDALADVIVFLASDLSRGITGAAIPVYGRS
ncbi:SDR family NAD(P)-dependent oxidoreductase [Thermochromatium tepidum]|uniref:SDR family NAD(P)-dependent oxidoreductase n=1 Tax=Thermochromatium tepidum ATCC 43061 TaxID=316276 RepID=A0A6I6EDV4_THETI|nr:SDR family NAD(P)-dependent oxidoreductase [Thermochromatium tepidum]QGU31597.1 SDR family NAD(P)-dependent oxidoreductase [Thermochromatium tepidum ATCC 43061]